MAEYHVSAGAFVCGSWGRLWDCEVIGNIFDNPELLEAK